MPPDPPRAFLVSQSASNLFCRKNTPTKMWKLWPPHFKVSRYATAGSIYGRSQGGGHYPPPNPSRTKTKILVPMINTCHCVIVFLLGFKWAYKEEIQYNFAFCVGQSCDGAAAMASDRSGVIQLFKTNLRWHIT